MKAPVLFYLFISLMAHSQTTVHPDTGDAYFLFGPNTNWGQYFQVGGNGRVTSHASVMATNGNLHLDSRSGSSYATYINYYSKGNTLINTQGGKVGIGTTSPNARLEIQNASDIDETDVLVYSTSTSNSLAGWSRISLKRINDPDQGFMSFYGNNSSGMILGVTGYNPLRFYTNNIERVKITSDGNLGVGTSYPDAKLTVKGNIHAEEVKVGLSVPGPDYVFKDDYNLQPLEEVQNYIKEHGHLPNIPSAKEMEANGIQLGEMNMKLLEKIEELTLYVLEQERKHIEKDRRILVLEERLRTIEQFLNR